MVKRQLAYLVIPGELPSVNEMVNKNRQSPYAGATLKKRATKRVEDAARASHLGSIKEKVDVHFTWYCPNRRKDPDNISGGAKFILDGLVNAGVLKNDGWSQVGGILHQFSVDRVAPRVEVGLYETRP